MFRARGTRKRAVRAALIGTPLVVFTAVALIAVTSAPATRKSPLLPSNGAPPRAVRSASAPDPGAYWTAARMKAAVSVAAHGGTDKAVTAASSATGKAGKAGGYAPPSLLSGAADPLTTTQASRSAPAPASGSVPGPNVTWIWFGRYRKYPMSTLGKLFFTKPGVGNFVCSAAATSGGTGTPQNIIWTAGDCVSDGNSHWYDNWLFCPSYDESQGGINPAVGCWSWSWATTSDEWFTSAAGTRDYAALGLQACGTVICSNVGDATGSLGFTWNLPRDQIWMMFGYPAGSPYTGGKIVATAAEHRFDDQPDALGPADNSIGSGQTTGTNGGPWITNFSDGSNSLPSINSNSAYTYAGQEGVEIYGPYFDTQTCQFWKGLTNWSGSC